MALHVYWMDFEYTNNLIFLRYLRGGMKCVLHIMLVTCVEALNESHQTITILTRLNTVNSVT